jgi:uncharacterized protein YfaS (alpha-2-macroglobulin family)
VIRHSSATLPGTVEKIIPSRDAFEAEKMQIEITGADDIYREIRIENRLIDDNGKPVRLKKGATVAVTVEVTQEDEAVAS